MRGKFSGNKLWAARVRGGLSIEALAERSGVKGSIISELESGTRLPQLATEMVLAQALGVPLRTLYSEVLSE